MWLEELAWLWLPVVGVFGLWVLWSNITLRAEVRALRERLEQLEAGVGARGGTERRAA